MPDTEGARGSIVRVRAGLLLMVALLLLCLSGGTFIARQFQLGYGWALLMAAVIALAVGYGVFRLTNRLYLGIAGLVTLATTYLAYDFLRNAMQWSAGVSMVLAAIPFVILVAAFWDFRRLKGEVRAWANRR
ncbi:hypothetical protein GCM10007301_48490 [Azorhizobium oxalatiphilum]|uniref:Transmembrane protein n=2 Tax=Azorhizobium oxalatiphilum TaxID=980631 RepID=A0A917CBT2_9HYPH|nr:hypothetical protein GCM10007301_48490 [Azorhizobium oxalatiphilum]